MVRLGYVRHCLLRCQLSRPHTEAGAEEEAEVSSHPDLHGLHGLPHHLLAGALPAPQQYRGETGHRHDHPPHPHLHVCQRATVSFSPQSSFFIIDIVQVCTEGVLRDLPGHVDGLLHRLRLPGAGGVQCNLPPELPHPV